MAYIDIFKKFAPQAGMTSGYCAMIFVCMFSDIWPVDPVFRSNYVSLSFRPYVCPILRIRITVEKYPFLKQWGGHIRTHASLHVIKSSGLLSCYWGFILILLKKQIMLVWLIISSDVHHSEEHFSIGYILFNITVQEPMTGCTSY